MAYKTFNQLLEIKSNQITRVFHFKNTTKRKLYFTKFDLIPDLYFASFGSVIVEKNGIVVFDNSSDPNVLKRYSLYPIQDKLYSLDRDEEMQISILDNANSADNISLIKLGISIELDPELQPLTSVLIPFTAEELSKISKSITLFPKQSYHALSAQEKTKEIDLENYKQIVITIKSSSEYDPKLVSNDKFLPPVNFVDELEKADYYNNTTMRKTGTLNGLNGITWQHQRETLTTHSMRIDHANFVGLRETHGGDFPEQPPLFDMSEDGTELTTVVKIADNRFEVIVYRLSIPFSFSEWTIIHFGHFNTNHIYDNRAIAGFKINRAHRIFWFYEIATGWQDYKYFYVGNLPDPYAWDADITVNRVRLSEPENYNKFKICGMDYFYENGQRQLLFCLNRLSADDLVKQITFYQFRLLSSIHLDTRIFVRAETRLTLNHIQYASWSRDGYRLFWIEENENTYYQFYASTLWRIATNTNYLEFDQNRTIPTREKIAFFVPNLVNNLILLTKDPITNLYYFEQHEISQIYGYSLFDNLADDYEDIELIPPDVNLRVPFVLNATHSSDYIADSAVYDLVGIENNPSFDYEFEIESPTDFDLDIKKTDLKNVHRKFTTTYNGSRGAGTRPGGSMNYRHYALVSDKLTFTRKGIRIFTENMITLIITGSNNLDFEDSEEIKRIDNFDETKHAINFTTQYHYVKFEKMIRFDFFVEPITETDALQATDEVVIIRYTPNPNIPRNLAALLAAIETTPDQHPYSSIHQIYDNPAYFPPAGASLAITPTYTSKYPYDRPQALNELMPDFIASDNSRYIPNNLKTTTSISSYDSKFVFHKAAKLPPLENESIQLGLEIKDVNGNWFDLVENLGSINLQGETVLTVNSFSVVDTVILPQGQQRLRFILKIQGSLETEINAILT